MHYLWVRCPAIREKVVERPVRRDRQHEAVKPVDREKVIRIARCRLIILEM